MNLFHLLDGSAKRYPARTAVSIGETEIYSYSSLRDAALRLAFYLQEHSGPGDRIVIASKNSPEFLPIMFGAWAAGVVVVPINCKLHPQEMGQIIEDCDPVFVFASRDLVGKLTPHEAAPNRVIELGSARYKAIFAGDLAEPSDIDPQDLAWLFYTSGTTGRSKGAMLSHRNLLAMTISHLADFEQISALDNIIHAAPMSHGSGLYILPYVARGAGHIVPASQGFDADEFIELSSRNQGCGAFFAPTMVRRLTQAVRARGLVPPVRSIIYGGGPMYSTDINAALEVFGPIFRQLYGQGESPMTITGLRQSDFLDLSHSTRDSVGWARSGVQVKIVDADGADCKTGAVGEILCRGDTVMQGYWNDANATTEALVAGWLRTGDMGSLDETGMLSLRGRSKEVVISGGTNIYPKEVEDVLLAHPMIDEVAVLGVRDEEWGEAVTACIVSGKDGSPSPNELDQYCLSRMARFKRPQYYVFVDALPRNAFGKVLKRVLSDQIADNPSMLVQRG